MRLLSRQRRYYGKQPRSAPCRFWKLLTKGKRPAYHTCRTVTDSTLKGQMSFTLVWPAVLHRKASLWVLAPWRWYPGIASAGRHNLSYPGCSSHIASKITPL